MLDTTAQTNAAQANGESLLAMWETRQMTNWGKQYFEFALGLQKAYLAELAQAGNEAFEWLKGEIEIESELVTGLASAHSVHDIAAACSECGRQRAEALQRDSRKLLERGQRLCQQTSKLLSPSSSQS